MQVTPKIIRHRVHDDSVAVVISHCGQYYFQVYDGYGFWGNYDTDACIDVAYPDMAQAIAHFDRPVPEGGYGT